MIGVQTMLTTVNLWLCINCSPTQFKNAHPRIITTMTNSLKQHSLKWEWECTAFLRRNQIGVMKSGEIFKNALSVTLLATILVSTHHFTSWGRKHCKTWIIPVIALPTAHLKSIKCTSLSTHSKARATGSTVADNRFCNSIRFAGVEGAYKVTKVRSVFEMAVGGMQGNWTRKRRGREAWPWDEWKAWWSIQRVTF